jgi:uncharacterized protein (TIGR00297 family)
MTGVDFVVALLLPLLVAIVAYELSAVSPGGAVAVFFVAFLSYAAFGLWAAGYVAAILASSNLVTRFKYNQKKASGTAEPGRGGRDVWRILGGAGTAGLLASFVMGGVLPAALGRAGFVVALAITNSDTWASELGVLSSGRPRLLSFGLPEADPGISGAVSVFGELASVVGAAFGISLSLLLGLLGEAGVARIAVLFGFAVIGEHLDSVLGASIQEAYICTKCNRYTDNPVHRCGSTTRLIRGSRIVTNTRINFISSMVGSILTVVFFMTFSLS